MPAVSLLNFLIRSRFLVRSCCKLTSCCPGQGCKAARARRAVSLILLPLCSFSTMQTSARRSYAQWYPICLFRGHQSTRSSLALSDSSDSAFHAVAPASAVCHSGQDMAISQAKAWSSVASSTGSPLPMHSSRRGWAIFQVRMS